MGVANLTQDAPGVLDTILSFNRLSIPLSLYLSIYLSYYVKALRWMSTRRYTIHAHGQTLSRVGRTETVESGPVSHSASLRPE